jgi:hypothetical protein
MFSQWNALIYYFAAIIDTEFEMGWSCPEMVIVSVWQIRINIEIHPSILKRVETGCSHSVMAIYIILHQINKK